MRNFFSSLKHRYTHRILSNEISQNVAVSLVHHVYMQTYVALFAATFCAAIIFVGLYFSDTNHAQLYFWAELFILITILRIALVYLYKSQAFPQARINLWRDLYVLGALLAGISWGYLGVFMLPEANIIQQMLIILMVAGVTAGAVPLSSAIPGAAIAFLICSVLPFIITIATFDNYMYRIFDLSLTLYLIYSIVLVMRSYHLIKNIIVLRFENDALLNSLSETKNQLEVINNKLALAGSRDPLTQIGNRSLFQLSLQDAIDRAKKNNSLIALFYINIDNFKSVNDRFGHHSGDILLLILVERLKNIFSNDMALARIGGDELTIILENANDLAAISNIAQQICQLIATPVRTNDTELRVHASIGISIYPYDGEDIDTLLRVANQYMREVKARGGNNFYFNTEYMKL